MDLTVCEILWINIKKNCWVNKGIPKSCIFKCWNFANGSSELHNLWYSLKGPEKTFQMHLNILPNWDWFFAVSSRKYIKWAIFDNLMTRTLEVNITRNITPFFSSTLWALSVGTFHFYILKTCKTCQLLVYDMLCSQFDADPMSWMKHYYYNLNIAQYAVFSFPKYNLNKIL